MSQSQAGTPAMSPAMEQAIAQGPPYPPQGAAVGGMPSISVDVAPLSVFIFLYLASAITNIFLFRRNLKSGHKFIISGILVGFSMARVLTCTLRIVWAAEPHNISLAIAANIFVNAGILLVYIINLLFALRILRARRPEIGWNSILRIGFRIVYAMLGSALILIIVMTVYSFYTLNSAVHSYAMWIQRGAILFLFIVAALPLIMVPLALTLPPSSNAETFGHGSITSKAIILLVGTCLCTIIAGFKIGTVWSDPRPADNPAWYQSKAAFYVFNFTLEILILSLYIGARVDQRFYVPDGSSKRKSYGTTDGTDSDDGSEKPESLQEKRDSGLGADAA